MCGRKTKGVGEIKKYIKKKKGEGMASDSLTNYQRYIERVEQDND
jgi:hypothetical protein